MQNAATSGAPQGDTESAPQGDAEGAPPRGPRRCDLLLICAMWALLLATIGVSLAVLVQLPWGAHDSAPLAPLAPPASARVLSS